MHGAYIHVTDTCSNAKTQCRKFHCRTTLLSKPKITICHDQESNLGSGSNDSSSAVTNHYPEMSECGRNLNYGFFPRLMAKSVIISYQVYMNLLTNDSIINFNETKRKEEEKNKKEKKKHIT